MCAVRMRSQPLKTRRSKTTPSAASAWPLRPPAPKAIAYLQVVLGQQRTIIMNIRRLPSSKVTQQTTWASSQPGLGSHRWYRCRRGRTTRSGSLVLIRASPWYSRSKARPSPMKRRCGWAFRRARLASRRRQTRTVPVPNSRSFLSTSGFKRAPLLTVWIHNKCSTKPNLPNPPNPSPSSKTLTPTLALVAASTQIETQSPQASVAAATVIRPSTTLRCSAMWTMKRISTTSFSKTGLITARPLLLNKSWRIIYWDRKQLAAPATNEGRGRVAAPPYRATAWVE